LLIRRPPDLTDRDVTDLALYLRRREFLGGAVRAAGLLALGAGGVPLPACGDASPPVEAGAPAGGRFADVATTKAFSTDEEPTAWESATTYNNFYEFGTDKTDPSERAGRLETEPWSVVFEGELAKPGRMGLEDVLRPHDLEERIYRLRCVEAWSMVIPWVGFPLGALLRRFEPTSKAKYVAFRTLHDPEQMPGQRRPVLDWPYREGLRMDEAMHPLTLLVVGMYGRELPNQNGAPLRLVVPWKYGFKSIKSIVGIRLQEEQPETSWNQAAPREYGFYANVNPEVDHPRWSQARERRIGEWTKRPTLPFNGYADRVGDLYAGMDLRQHF